MEGRPEIAPAVNANACDPPLGAALTRQHAADQRLSSKCRARYQPAFAPPRGHAQVTHARSAGPGTSQATGPGPGPGPGTGTGTGTGTSTSTSTSTSTYSEHGRQLVLRL